MSTINGITRINFSEIETNVPYKATSFFKEHDSCDYAFMLIFEKVSDSTWERVVVLTNNNCYLYNKLNDIHTGELPNKELIFIKRSKILTSGAFFAIGCDNWTELHE